MNRFVSSSERPVRRRYVTLETCPRNSTHSGTLFYESRLNGTERFLTTSCSLESDKFVNETVRNAPVWVRATATLSRRLPAGRYWLPDKLCPRATLPFL